jgi:hypothetical protein
VGPIPTHKALPPSRQLQRHTAYTNIEQAVIPFQSSDHVNRRVPDAPVAPAARRSKTPSGSKDRCTYGSKDSSEEEWQFQPPPLKQQAKQQQPWLTQTEPDFMPRGRTAVKFFPSWLSSSKEPFLSTIFAALYASSHPFGDFQKGNKAALNAYRTAFKAVWPDSTHKVTTDDCLFHLVCTSLSDDRQGFDFSFALSQAVQRVTEKQNKIFTHVLTELKAHLESEEIESPDDIKKWIKYFLATAAGPVVYAEPIPQGGVYNEGAAGYQVSEFTVL